MVFLIDLAERPVGFFGKRALFRIEFEFLDQPGELFLCELGQFSKHLGALGLALRQQHTLKPANDYDGQNDALVFISLEFAAQPLGGFPDVTCEIIELGFVKGERH